MFEMLLNPRKAQRAPWEMFVIGLVYASLSLLIVNWVFAQDAVLSRYSGILIVTFTVMFSMPFVYYSLKLEENKISFEKGTIALLKEHKNALYTFMWLFLGFVVAFAFWYILLQSPNSFRAQIETYCLINRPSMFNECVSQYGIKNTLTSFATSKERLLVIFTNNIYVLIFTLIFSLIFGAGVIFILAWNASVIAAAIGIFTKSSLQDLPIGLARYMIHGIPEIMSYFIVALAGGLISIAVIKHEVGTERFWEVLQDSLNLIILSIIVLFIAALMEVFLTPLLF
ncbi:MAG: stage II sporulation protein M [Candidatus Pacearchaeota archaeon]|nr:stage II sporulation protein M [Candidatus Pacearchaeota archaeon]